MARRAEQRAVRLRMLFRRYISVAAVAAAEVHPIPMRSLGALEVPGHFTAQAAAAAARAPIRFPIRAQVATEAMAQWW